MPSRQWHWYDPLGLCFCFHTMLSVFVVHNFFLLVKNRRDDELSFNQVVIDFSFSRSNVHRVISSGSCFCYAIDLVPESSLVNMYLIWEPESMFKRETDSGVSLSHLLSMIETSQLRFDSLCINQILIPWLTTFTACLSCQTSNL